MAADRLRALGWGAVRRDYPERGPLASAWVDADEVVAVRSTERDSLHQHRSEVTLTSGVQLVVLGTPEEVVRQLQ